MGSRRGIYVILAVILSLLFCAASAKAQEHAPESDSAAGTQRKFSLWKIKKEPVLELAPVERKSNVFDVEELPFIDRWAIKTNVLEWALTIPNLSFEFDLGKSVYNKNAVSLTAKYNWNTFHSLAPSWVFNLFDFRGEFRHYYRYKSFERGHQDEKANFFQKLLSTERKNPKTWRAYYIGGYANYAGYSFKFSPTGVQGTAAGVGVSFGYVTPLYQYKKGSIDLDLGLSLGFQVTEYDKFTHDSATYTYGVLETKPFHFTPFPVASELRVAIEWRHKSIADKYTQSDPRIKAFKDAREDVKSYFKTSNKKDFDGTKDEQELNRYADNPEIYLEDFKAYVKESAESAYGSINNNTRIDDKSYEKLLKLIQDCYQKAVRQFEEEIRDLSREKVADEKNSRTEKSSSETEKPSGKKWKIFGKKKKGAEGDNGVETKEEGDA